MVQHTRQTIENKFSLVKDVRVQRCTLALALFACMTVANAQYTFYDGEYGLLSAGLHVQTAGLGEINNRSGDPFNYQLSDMYWELTVEPNIKAAINLPQGSQFYGGFSMIYSAMLGYDPSFFTTRGIRRSNVDEDIISYSMSQLRDDYTDWFMSEELYIGWRSGKMFEQWGENAIDLSTGAQDYKLGSGFLLGNGTDDGGYRGSYWIGSRTTFIDTVVARINIGSWKLEGFHLRNRPRNPTNVKRYNGMNIEYNYHNIANFAFSYINDDDYSGNVRAETDAYNVRVNFLPLPETLPDLSISTEYVCQLNNKFQDNNWDPNYDAPPPTYNFYQYGEIGKKTVHGGYGQIEYKFSELPWQPKLSYRYAIMGYGFDYMNFGYTTWGTWYQGEMMGEFLTDTTNLISHVARLIVKPTENVTVNLIYYNFAFDNPKGMYVDWGGNSVTSKNFGNEIDLVVDWSVTDSIDLAAGIETLIPSRGASQVFDSQVKNGPGNEEYGGNKMWIQGMVYASFKF